MIRIVLYFVYGLVVLMLVRMVMRALGRLFGVASQGRPAGSPPRQERSPERRLAEDLVRDPVCQTYVPRSRALSATVEGHQEFFCSEECRERARATVASAS